MASTCNSCGSEAVEGQFYREESTPFFGQKIYCPNCDARRQRKTLERMLLGYLACGILGLILFVALPNWRGMGVFLLNLFFFQFFHVAATIPHELGHGFVARWFGFEVRQLVVGFGSPVFHCRIFGFPFEFRRVPLGGLADVLPDDKPRFRIRCFLMVLAGPAVNFVLASIAYFGFRPIQHINFNFIYQLNPIGLFVLANLIVVVENLIPHRASTSHGVCDSDGYQLLKLLVGEPKPRREPKIEKSSLIWQRILTVGAVLFLSLCALLCFSLCVVVASLEFHRNSAAILVLLCTPFIASGCYVCWVIYRIAKGELGSSQANNGHVSGADELLSPYFPLTESHTKDLDRIAEWSGSVSPLRFCTEINALLEREKYMEAAGRLRQFLDVTPRNLNLQMTYASTLWSLGRLDDAAAVYEGLGGWEDLSLGSRVILKGERLRFLVLQGKFEQAAIECEEFLSQTESVIAKANILDGLASLPHGANQPDYLHEADKWSRRALEIAPGFITLKGTRASVLADLGRFAEAKPLLTEVIEQSESNIDKGISSLYLALCAKAEGDLINAKKLAKQAARIYPQPWLLKRLQTEGIA